MRVRRPCYAALDGPWFTARAFCIGTASNIPCTTHIQAMYKLLLHSNVYFPCELKSSDADLGLLVLRLSAARSCASANAQCSLVPLTSQHDAPGAQQGVNGESVRHASGLVLGTNVVQLPAWDMTSRGQQQKEHVPPVDSSSRKTNQSSTVERAAAPHQPFIEFKLVCRHGISPAAPATPHGRPIPQDACTPRPRRIHVILQSHAASTVTTASAANASSACTISRDGSCAPQEGGVPIVDVTVGPGGDGGVGFSPGCSRSGRWVWGSRLLVAGLVLAGWGGARVCVKRLYCMESIATL